MSIYSSQDTASDDTHSHTMPIRLAAYNIAHGRGVAESNWNGGNAAERKTRLDRLANLLQQIDADVVILNEVDFDSSWSHSANQARYLAEKAGYPHWTEQRNFDFRVLLWTWRFGNAVLSKYPITEARVVELPGYSVLESALFGKKRGIACDISLGDSSIRVIAVHLSHRSESVRVDSASMLAGIAAESTLPTIIAGDLNSTPPGFPESVTDVNGNNAIAVLDELGHFRRTPTEPPTSDDQLTFHAANPKSIIDWILIPADWKFLQYAVQVSELSDHRPVFADVVPSPD